ncbi:hypothetical protein RUM43_001207 [Polyplax serrata]|uniref:Periodic tryptophan protein 1 n=1 Tax=Polyplax serrata TaxID=468196 RepID=A0AAN8SFW3_POLSC
MEEEFDTPKVNFVPCVKIVRQGASKSNPVQIQLTRPELVKLSKNVNVNTDDLNEDEDEQGTEAEAPTNEADEYDMEHYNDDDRIAMKVSDIAIFEDDDPYKSASIDLPDSDEEDDIIKPNDNLVLVGHVEGATPILEVYVYNEKEDSFYCHHDYLLPKIPLALEWLNHDPTNTNEPGNLCAVGYVTPIIGVWDLDIVNCVEPAFKLGKKGNARNRVPRVGHKKAVLDLSWNQNFHHILASGSVDETVILWDLDKAEPSITLDCFEGSAQSLKWHSEEAQTLLVGSGDKTCRVFDCRTSDVQGTYKVKGEVEKVLWNPFSKTQFIASDDKGYIYAFDCKQDKKLWEVQAHSQEVTGVAFSSSCPGLLCTTCQDGQMKVWDIQSKKPECVHERNLKIGAIHCLDSAPDLPFIMASGGDNKSKNLIVFNAMKKPEVKEAFQGRFIASSSKRSASDKSTEKEDDDVEMETT